MRLLLNYITRRLLVSALCSATQTALVAPGHIEMLFRHQAVREQQFVGAPLLSDVVTISELPDLELQGGGVASHSHSTSNTGVRDLVHLPPLDAFAVATSSFSARQM